MYDLARPGNSNSRGWINSELQSWVRHRGILGGTGSGGVDLGVQSILPVSLSPLPLDKTEVSSWTGLAFQALPFLLTSDICVPWPPGPVGTVLWNASPLLYQGAQSPLFPDP